MIQEPHFGTEASKVYGEALEALDRSGIRYMLGGALALNAYTGIWRDTKDLDVFVPKELVPRVLETLQEAGFETGVEDPLWLAKAWRGDFFADVIHATHNGTGPVKESWFAYAEEIFVLGRRVLVVSVEETILIAPKVRETVLPRDNDRYEAAYARYRKLYPRLCEP